MSLNKKIMIVEDNSTLSDMYKFKFELEGFNVLVCNNGISAVKNVESYKPDILLVDIMMPEMNGYEFIERARSQKLIPE
jgi:DNA-binding response OmpR family regulator